MLLFRVEAVPTKQPYLSSLFRELSSFHLSSHSLQGNNDMLIMKRWTVYRWWFMVSKKFWDHDFFRIWLLKWNTDRKMASIQKMRDRLGRLKKKRISKDKRFLKNRSTVWYPKNVLLFCIFVWLDVFIWGLLCFFGWLTCLSLACFRILRKCSESENLELSKKGF